MRIAGRDEGRVEKQAAEVMTFAKLKNLPGVEQFLSTGVPKEEFQDDAPPKPGILPPVL